MWTFILILAVAFIIAIIISRKASIKVNGKEISGMKKVPYGFIAILIAILGIIFAIALVALFVGLGLGIIGIVVTLIIITIPVVVLIAYFTTGITINDKIYRFRKNKDR
ncbi:MAG: hypothetical protein MR639_14910 [Clostridium sp.]|uniref:hypothetical protein n=1 Tax=Clostridium sp. TaxID=1506 RepID=UPI002A8E2965|nr:hypothetical protein [Clostridium sp.]MDY5098806.1 hypothetical protein [Clostridium sp.]